jgi:hypothetical protein
MISPELQDLLDFITSRLQQPALITPEAVINDDDDH